MIRRGAARAARAAGFVGLVAAGAAIGVGLVPASREAAANITVFDPQAYGQAAQELSVIREQLAEAKKQLAEAQTIAAQLQGDVNFVLQVAQAPAEMAQRVTGCLFSFSMGSINPPSHSVCDVSEWVIKNLFAEKNSEVNQVKRENIRWNRAAVTDEAVARGVAAGRFTVKQAPEASQGLANLATDIKAAAGKPADAANVTNKLLLKLAEDTAANRLLLGQLLEVLASAHLEQRPVLFTGTGNGR